MDNKLNGDLEKSNQPQYKLCSILVLFDDTERCPFCHQKLNKSGAVVETLVYKKSDIIRTVRCCVSFCSKCLIPIAQYSEIKPIIEKLKPYEIHMLAAKYMRSPKRALDACYGVTCNVRSKGRIPAHIRKKFTEKTKYHFRYDPDTWRKSPPTIARGKEDDVLWIFSKKCTCKDCFDTWKVDTIVNRAAVVSTKSGKLVEVNVQFCMSCGKFYMNYESFKACQKIYGGLDVDLIYDHSIIHDDFEHEFDDYSILSTHGYNVKNGTPRTTRQSILSHILDEKISTKHEIIKLLTQFIKINKNRCPDACRKWQEDILFVNQYHIEDQENVGLLQIKQGGKIKKDG